MSFSKNRSDCEGALVDGHKLDLNDLAYGWFIWPELLLLGADPWNESVYET
jgi:hypothetical protein